MAFSVSTEADISGDVLTDASSTSAMGRQFVTQKTCCWLGKSRSNLL